MSTLEFLDLWAEKSTNQKGRFFSHPLVVSKEFLFQKDWEGPGRLFPREPVNFVHREWTLSQEISQSILKCLTNLTYFAQFGQEKSF